MLMFALVGTTTSLAFADTLNVPSDFGSIQAAVDAASDGDTVRVRGGSYEEFVVISKRIRLDGRRSPFLLGSIDIQADRVTVQGFDIRRELEDNGFGIRVAGDRARVRRNNVLIVNIDDDDGEGILVLGDRNEIEDNEAIGGSNPIDVRGNNNEILDNSARSAIDDGFSVTGSYNLLEDNEASGSGTEAAGMDIRGTDNTLIDNKANNNDDGFIVFGEGHLFQGNDANDNEFSGFTVNCDFCVFNGLNQSVDNGQGFRVNGDGNLFDDNEADDNEEQGWFIFGDNNRFIGNGADNNGIGMAENDSATGNEFEENSCKDNNIAAVPSNICDDPND